MSSIPTSVDEIQHLEVKLYPNPAQESFKVNVNKEGNMYVSDCMGRIIYYRSVYSGENSIEISDWTSGMYVVNVNRFSKRLIVQ